MTNETTKTGEPTFYRKAIEGVRLRHSAKTQQQIARQSEHNERMRQAVNAEAIPQLAEDGKGGEDVGDVMNIESPQTHYHYHGNEEPKPAEPGKKRSRVGTLAKLAIGAGLIATGVSIPFGVSAIVSALDKPEAKTETPATPETKDPTDRRYLLDLGD